jgi:hypothetical protein
MCGIRKGWETFWRWFDRAARADFAVHIVGTATVLAVLTPISTVLVAIWRGQNPILALFEALLGLALIGLLFLIALEVNSKMRRQKVAAAPAAPAAPMSAKIYPTSAVRADGRIDALTGTIDTEGMDHAVHVGESGSIGSLSPTITSKGTEKT